MNSSRHFVENNHALLREFNLSRHKCLRTLETTVESIDAAGCTASYFLKTVLSSVAPSTPIDVVIVYREIDLSNMPHCSQCDTEPVRLRLSPSKTPGKAALRFQHHFRVFRDMHETREFRLVLCADVFDCMVEYGVETLDLIVEVEEVMGGLDYLLQKPLTISERRTLRTRYNDHNTGWSREWGTAAAAL